MSNSPDLSQKESDTLYLNGNRPAGITIRTDLPGGAHQEETYCLFRLYCPKAAHIELVLFEYYDQNAGVHYKMDKLNDGYWQLEIPGRHTGKYYAYRVQHPSGNGIQHPPVLLADPWSAHVTTTNHYRQRARSLIVESEPFDWDGDTFVAPPELRDLIIYEAHIRDLTAHPSSGSRSPGTYKGFLEPDITGGINHLVKLGVNAVEFLPLQKFAGFEPPFGFKSPEGYHNTWNPYSRNYWGYMTSFFFAPETMYASDGSTRHGDITGRTTTAGQEIKQMVKELHRAGITVIMDVVYNHVSQYDLNPLKHLDKQEFFRLHENGEFTSESGCGNDLRTESPYIRELIVRSVLWWMQEYHIDGFRFDLANLIDRETIAEIRTRAEEINPNILLIAEPWGGGYDPTGFSGHGWCSWNDQIRNGVKGFDPADSPGFIFGRWHHECRRESLENFLRGTLIHEPNGRFHHQEHAVNYLESHDGYTLGDFIRIALNPGKRDQVFNDKSSLVSLDEQELKCARLAALFLMTSQGIPMIHSGQEWGRSKWIPRENSNDPNAGKPDHNSYEKDDATNYLDYTEIDQNRPLFEYYRDLIRLRKRHAQLRLAEFHEFTFHPYADALHITFEIRCDALHPDETILVSLNGNPHDDQTILLPEGDWEILADDENVYLTAPPRVDSTTINVPSTSGIILRRKATEQNKTP